MAGWVGAIPMCYALFGAGFFVAGNASHYAAGCVSAPLRAVFPVIGMAAWPVLVLVARPRRRPWMRPTALVFYGAVALHALFSVVDGDHVAPLALLVVALLGGIRHDVCDALGMALVALPLGAAAVAVNLGVPVHAHGREVECGTFTAVAGLLAAGALHVLPATAVYAFVAPSPGADGAYFLALALHAPLLVAGTLRRGLWVPTLIESSRVDMFVGGVSGHELWTLVAQASLLGVTAVATFWLMFRMVLRSEGMSERRLLAVEPYFLSVLATTGGALFLRHLSFAGMVGAYWAVLGGTLLFEFIF